MKDGIHPDSAGALGHHCVSVNTANRGRDRPFECRIHFLVRVCGSIAEMERLLDTLCWYSLLLASTGSLDAAQLVLYMTKGSRNNARLFNSFRVKSRGVVCSFADMAWATMTELPILDSLASFAVSPSG